jgi:uncharacterized protein (DUF433 family)
MTSLNGLADQGTGLYTIAEAAQIVGVRPATLHRWMNLLSGFPEDAGEQAPANDQAATDAAVPFLALIEYLLVKLLRDGGFSLTAIRAAARQAALRWQTAYPFAVKEFTVAGSRLLSKSLAQHDRKVVLDLVVSSEELFERIARSFARNVAYDAAGRAARYWPLGREERIVLDPERSFGQPIDAKTGVPTEVLFAAVQAGQGQSAGRVADWFEIPIAAVEVAVRYEAALRAA